MGKPLRVKFLGYREGESEQIISKCCMPFHAPVVSSCCEFHTLLVLTLFRSAEGQSSRAASVLEEVGNPTETLLVFAVRN